MSYHSWTTKGYGINTNDIEHDTTKEKIEELLKLAPKFNNEIQTWFLMSKIENPTKDDYLDYDCTFYSGIAYLLQGVIDEVENIRLDIAEDFDCYYYLLMTPTYQWCKLTNEEKEINTEEKMNKLFMKYVRILTNKDIVINYMMVENGG